MTSIRFYPARALVAIIVTLLAFAAASAPAIAQDLAQENEALKADVAKLTAQRDDLIKRVSELNREVQRLRVELAKFQKGTAPGGAPAAPGSAPSADPAIPAPSADNPLASPDAMLAFLRKEYEGKFGALPRENRAQESRFQREVGPWVRTAPREHRGAIEWTIRITEPDAASDRPNRLVFQVLGADGTPISQVHSAMLPGRWIRDVAGASAGDVWKIKGTLIPEPEFNPDRAENLPGEEPPLIGPYAEFGFNLMITSLAPAN